MASIKDLKRKKGIVWQAQVHRKVLGKTLTKVFDTRAEAVAWGQVWDGVASDELKKKTRPASKTATVEDAVTFYLEKVSIRKQDAGQFGILLHDFRDLKLQDLTAGAIQRKLGKLLETEVPKQDRKKVHPLYNGDKPKTYAASTVRKVYYSLRKVLRYYSDEQKIFLDPKIFDSVKPPEAWANKIGQRLSKDDEQRLIDSAMRAKYNAQSWVRFISLTLETACRLQEITQAGPAQLIRRNGVLVALDIPEANDKTKIGRTVSLTDKAVELIEAELKVSKNGNLFNELGDNTNISANFHRIAKRAGLPHRFHDLRHEATSRLAESGIFQLHELMKITGHKELTTLLHIMEQCQPK